MGNFRAGAGAHLTFPRLRRGPPSPLNGGEGLLLPGRPCAAASRRKAVNLLRAILAVAAFLVLSANIACADDAPTRADVWTLKLGTPASALSSDAFVDYACGNNGGPPQQALTGWSEYQKCQAEPNGLREVYFRYDDELEYWAKAHRARTLIAQYAGTKVADFPVILSGLFDANGVLAGLRIVTDPQASPQDRKQAYTLTNFFKARYGNDGWDCVDTPPAPGESPVGTLYINRRCTKLVKGDMRAVLETRFLRKPGQAEFSGSGKLTVGQFESSSRLELLRPDIPVE